jgi:ubiquitin carboxyl-terminal hydrolase 5/13
MNFSEAELKTVRIPDGPVHKDECRYSFDTPDSAPHGLLVCLTDHLGFGSEHADLHWEKTNHTLFLRIRRERRVRQQQGQGQEQEQGPALARPDGAEPPAKRQTPTVLGIGVPGGFATEADKFETVVTYSVVRLPTGRELPLVVSGDDAASIAVAPGAQGELPDALASAVRGVILAESFEHRREVEEFKVTEQKPLAPSRHAETLVQQPRRPEQQVGPATWHCEHPGCTFTENLWLNLTDGVVMCGRPNFVGLGNGHALQHYEATGFPLAVKLGTITDTEADVYSYAEDDLVIDPRLAEHLHHFGIERASLTKTDKTLAELTIDVAMRFEFNRVTEAGKKLVPVFGPGLTGLKNLGNSCYMASVLQVVFSVPAFIERYATAGVAAAIFRDGPPDPTGSFRLQLAKLGFALNSGRYSVPEPLAIGEVPDPKAEPK